MATTIPPVSKLSSRIIRILGQNPGPMTLQGTNTYLIGIGERRILLDTGDGTVPQYINTLKSVIKENNVKLAHIIFTHWHRDHTGGIKDIFENVDTTDCLVWKYPHESNDGDIPKYIKLHYLKDKQIISVEDTNVKIYHTPGHTSDHIVLLLNEENALFSGDCILGEGTVVFEDLYDYMKSLEKIRKIKSSIIYPGHGNVIESPTEKIEFYIHHRKQRESQIFELFKNNPTTIFSEMDIVKKIYIDTPHLLKAAAVNVSHHIKKLMKEDKISLIEGQWKYKNN